LTKEFCDGYYGPASRQAMDYINAMEESVRKPIPRSMSEFGDPRELFTPASIKHLEGLLEKAKDRCASADPKYLRRVKELGSGLEAIQLWFPGPLVERNGKLVREDQARRSEPGRHRL